MKYYFSFQILLLLLAQVAFAQSSSEIVIEKIENELNQLPKAKPSQNLVVKRTVEEMMVVKNPFVIAYHRQNYVMPFYYTGSPYNSVYGNNIPNNETIKNLEVKFQLSLKLPLFPNHIYKPFGLYFAYTQLSYWQLYNKYAFFRETDYEPEVFLNLAIDRMFYRDWAFNGISLGASHQSNGFGNHLERSWNRVYLDFILSKGNLMLSIKPWYVIKDPAYVRYNPNLASYLGYGWVTFAYKNNCHVYSLQLRNLFGKFAAEATWSFLLTPSLKVYFQGYSGYGQSLIEYNHRTNSIGVGIAFSNWL